MYGYYLIIDLNKLRIELLAGCLCARGQGPAPPRCSSGCCLGVPLKHAKVTKRDMMGGQSVGARVNMSYRSPASAGEILIAPRDRVRKLERAIFGGGRMLRQ